MCPIRWVIARNNKSLSDILVGNRMWYFWFIDYGDRQNRGRAKNIVLNSIIAWYFRISFYLLCQLSKFKIRAGTNILRFMIVWYRDMHLLDFIVFFLFLCNF